MSKNKLTAFWMGVAVCLLVCLAPGATYADEAIDVRPAAVAEAISAPTTTRNTDSSEGGSSPRYVGAALMAANAGQALVVLPTSAVPPPSVPVPDPPNIGPARTYALVDQALIPQVFTLLPPGAYSSVVEIPGLQGDDAQAILPVLIELPDAEAPREAIARLTMHWARERHAATWLLSPRPIQQMAEALASIMKVQLAEDVQLEGRSTGQRSALLRLADSRVLAATPRILDRAQLQALLGIAQQWRYLDRNEALRTLQGPDDTEEEAEEDAAGHESDPHDSARRSLPLVLKTDQVASFRAASLPDEVFRIANAITSGGLNGFARPVRHAYVLDEIQKARSLGMVSSQEIGLYIAIALRKGEGFFAGARWRSAADRARAGEVSWMDVLASDDLWP